MRFHLPRQPACSGSGLCRPLVHPTTVPLLCSHLCQRSVAQLCVCACRVVRSPLSSSAGQAWCTPLLRMAAEAPLRRAMYSGEMVDGQADGRGKLTPTDHSTKEGGNKGSSMARESSNRPEGCTKASGRLGHGMRGAAAVSQGRCVRRTIQVWCDPGARGVQLGLWLAIRRRMARAQAQWTGRAVWDKAGQLTDCGRWAGGMFVKPCAVPLQFLPAGKHLTTAAQQAKSAHPNDSALFAEGAHFVGELELAWNEWGRWGGRQVPGRVCGPSPLHSRRRIPQRCRSALCLRYADAACCALLLLTSTALAVPCSVRCHLQRSTPNAIIPNETALMPDGSHYIGSLNGGGQPHGEGASFRPDGSPATSCLSTLRMRARAVVGSTASCARASDLALHQR